MLNMDNNEKNLSSYTRTRSCLHSEYKDVGSHRIESRNFLPPSLPIPNFSLHSLSNLPKSWDQLSILKIRRTRGRRNHTFKFKLIIIILFLFNLSLIKFLLQVSRSGRFLKFFQVPRSIPMRMMTSPRHLWIWMQKSDLSPFLFLSLKFF